MSFFKWDPAQLSVKVQAMDDEHQKLIEIMNRLYAKADSKASKAELAPVLKELASYATKHFSDEEKFFDSIPNYPNAKAHKLIHQDLLQRVGKYVKEFETGSGTIAPEFFSFLKVWLTDHIAGVDKKYGEAAAKKAA